MRKQLSRDDKDAINASLGAYGIKEFITKKDNAERVDEDGRQVVIVNGQRALFYHEGKPYPTLRLLLTRDILPKIVVDMGAIKFVTSGADVMRPGIRVIPPDLAAGAPVVIVDEKHGKPLAVGLMMVDSAAMAAATSGKVIKNIHFVGDALWNAGT
jgi:PUA domain protein